MQLHVFSGFCDIVDGIDLDVARCFVAAAGIGDGIVCRHGDICTFHATCNGACIGIALDLEIAKYGGASTDLRIKTGKHFGLKSEIC